MNILVSSCLLGVNCRYNAKPVANGLALQLLEQFHVIPICPEVFGGLPTPRTPAEQRDGQVITSDGRDVTKEYHDGAKEILRLAKLYDCKVAVLKERSPSCGKGTIYDGTFSGTLTKGDGICAKYLLDAGITVLGESELDLLLSGEYFPFK